MQRLENTVVIADLVTLNDGERRGNLAFFFILLHVLQAILEQEFYSLSPL